MPEPRERFPSGWRSVELEQILSQVPPSVKCSNCPCLRTSYLPGVCCLLNDRSRGCVSKASEGQSNVGPVWDYPSVPLPTGTSVASDVCKLSTTCCDSGSTSYTSRIAPRWRPNKISRPDPSFITRAASSVVESLEEDRDINPPYRDDLHGWPASHIVEEELQQATLLKSLLGSGGKKPESTDVNGEGSESQRGFFRGVRQRPGVRGFLVEIRPPKWKRTIWLGTYPTLLEAAHAYDAGIFYTGKRTPFNFAESKGSFPPLPPHLSLNDFSPDVMRKIKLFVKQQALEAANRAKVRTHNEIATPAVTVEVDGDISEDLQPILTAPHMEGNWSASSNVKDDLCFEGWNFELSTPPCMHLNPIPDDRPSSYDSHEGKLHGTSAATEQEHLIASRENLHMWNAWLDGEGGEDSAHATDDELKDRTLNPKLFSCWEDEYRDRASLYAEITSLVKMRSTSIRPKIGNVGVASFSMAPRDATPLEFCMMGACLDKHSIQEDDLSSDEDTLDLLLWPHVVG